MALACLDEVWFFSSCFVVVYKPMAMGERMGRGRVHAEIVES